MSNTTSEAVHYRYYGAGRPACDPVFGGARRASRWKTTRNKDRVTCGNCLRVIKKERNE